LIDAEKVRAKIGTIVPVENLKESHLIELSKLPEKEQAQVAAKVIEQCEAENREPTAKDFRNAIKPEEKPKTGTIVPVEETEEPVYEDVDDEPTDSPAQEAIGNGKHLQTLQNLVNELLREMVLVPDVVGLELYHARFNRIKKEVESIKGHLVTVKPVAVCPRCDGAGCSQCGNHGWVSSATLKELGK
jgi:serine phosphatase RsbU (regulator of sigma subunit)